jgi:predicted transcriptional regulator
VRPVCRPRKRWPDLTSLQKRKRYEKAVRAHRNGFPGPPPGTFNEYAALQLKKDGKKPTPPPKKQKPTLPMPPYFGTSERTETLAILNANGPMTSRELARARNVDSASVFHILHNLLRTGLIAKREHGRGRKYFAINRSHVAYRDLKALLQALSKKYGTITVEQSRHRWRLPLETDPPPAVEEDRMFGSTLRSRIIVLLSSLEVADFTQVTRLLGASHMSVFYTMNTLERSGIVSSKKVGACRYFSFSNALGGHREFQNFLQTILAELPTYDSLKTLLPKVTFRHK